MRRQAVAFIAMVFILVAGAAAQGQQIGIQSDATMNEERPDPWTVLPSAELDLPCFDCGQDLVIYRDNELRRYFGRYVVVMVPDDWEHDRGLTDDERRILLDDADLSYEYLYQILGTEPEGDGHLTIAFVGGSYVWGRQGYKMIELSNQERQVEKLRLALTEGVVHEDLVETMSRNFELHWSDSGWLELMARDVFFYSRAFRSGMTADEQLQAIVDFGFMPYVHDYGATYESRGDYPIRWDSLWAGFSHLVTLHHGVDSMLGSKRFMSGLLSTVSRSDLDMADTYVESLAHGAQVDLGCYVDIVRWRASEELRERMSATFSSDSPFCIDSDRDGYSVFEGDCDDSSWDVRPRRTEIADGVDQDCDGAVDDLVLNEPLLGDFDNPMPVTIPTHIFGKLRKAEDNPDIFQLQVEAGTTLKIQFCNDHRSALKLRLRNDGVVRCDGDRWSAFGCEVWRNEFTESGTWYLEVYQPSLGWGDTYSLLIHETLLPEPFWSRIEVETLGGDTYLFTAESNLQSSSSVSPDSDSVRFWVSGYGFIVDLPWQPVVSYEWQPENEIEDGAYLVRAQVYRNGRPLSEISDRAYIGRPAPDFTWLLTGPPTNEGQPIRFEDRSRKSPDAWIWSIEEAPVSTDSSATQILHAGHYEVALVTSNSFGSARRTRQITIPDSSPMTLRITTTVYDKSRLYLRGNTARWQYLGESEWRYRDKKPTVINGSEWHPSWQLNGGVNASNCHCESDVFDGIDPPLAILPTVSVAITELTRGRNVTLVEQPSAENDYTLVLELTAPLDGSGTVDFKARINWQQPSPRRGRRHQ